MQNFAKKRTPKFGTKNVLFGYFWARILRPTAAIFEISTLKFVENESLTHTVDFSMGSTFSKCPGPVFSEGPGPDPGLGMLLYTAALRTGNWCFWFKWK